MDDLDTSTGNSVSGSFQQTIETDNSLDGCSSNEYYYFMQSRHLNKIKNVQHFQLACSIIII